MLNDPRKAGSAGNPIAVPSAPPGIDPKPNLSACPGRIDGDKTDTFTTDRPSVEEIRAAYPHLFSTSVEVY